MNYDNVAAPAGTVASVKIGDQTIAADALTPPKRSQRRSRPTAIRPNADPNDINYVMTVVLLAILVVYVTMVYGPIAAWLVELFPTRIRYSGCRSPITSATAGSAASCRRPCSPSWRRPAPHSGLWYPIAIAAMSFVVGLIFLPETKDRDITQM